MTVPLYSYREPDDGYTLFPKHVAVSMQQTNICTRLKILYFCLYWEQNGDGLI